MTPAEVQSRLQTGVGLLRGGNFSGAEQEFRAILKSDKRNFPALNLLAVTLMQQKRFADAEPLLKAACAVNAGSVSTIYNYGLVLNEMERPKDALRQFDTVVSLAPQDAEAWNSRGLALKALGRLDEAISSFDKAVAARPDYADVHFNKGNMLQSSGRADDALACYDRAIALNPRHAAAYHNRGNVLAERMLHEDALPDFQKTIELDPGNLDAYYGLGDTLHQLGRYRDAAEVYEKAYPLDPQPESLASLLRALRSRMQVCDWANYDRDVQKILRAEPGAGSPHTPFPLFSIPAGRDLLRRSAEHYAASLCPPAQRPLWNSTIYNHTRPRIGYFSSDFRIHPVAFLIAELFERHDRSRFEVVGFSLSRKADDFMAKRISSAFDSFYEVFEQGNLEIATLARNMEIDIAVDLNGFTAGGRSAIFAHRPAPVQVNYLGFPGTMGASYIDYIIGDPVLTPREHFGGYTEKVVQLPNSYQVNDRQRKIADAVPSRSALGLPEQGFVFCCFNNRFKITPDVFDVWMRLLAAVPGSVFWLLEDNAMARENLRAAAQARGISPDRLVFASRVAPADHLARQRQADLFLDTFYYNAHTTASDALWAGLPVVTRLGDTFASRVAASLLTAVGLPELIATSTAGYEALIFQLATDRPRLAEIRAKLERNIKTHPLFDTELYTRHIEDAYIQMWQRTCDGLPPDHIVVNS